jgi:hypothetical protein
VVVSKLHADTLRELARATGGAYFEAAAADYDPAPVERRILALGGRAIESAAVNSLEERFQWPLAAGAAALALLLAMSPFRWRATEAA